ncbi:hypothetical protein L1987_37051 [Smallanthus sonchifolius]|uniref:Uncharacterized protein n=1 Tax=Smallanthus sonchifolius TaxID=185202 RepID=A0ACB9HH14_9ASTR|nr:hypothetical protein L1987_37051 [Smallanthus sonchifolius]
MPPKRKRGPAKCLKMIKDPKDFKIEFDSNGLAIGETAAFFMSWVGKAFRKKIPYYQLVKDIDKQLYNDVWDSLKKDRKIPNDDAKSTIIKQGKVAMRNFRYTLVNKYAKKNKSPIEEYEDLDMSHWDSFVSKALSEEFEKTSQKAKISAGKNIDPARVGRRGFVGLEKVWEGRWNQLVLRYPHLAHMKDRRSRIYTVSRAICNPVTKLFELGPHLLSEEIEMKENGTYYVEGKDVVTEKKKTTKQADTLRDEIDALERDQYRVAAATQASSAIFNE